MQQIEIDRTDEEREELVKKWIVNYWLWITGVVLLSIAAVYGVNYYKQSKIEQMSHLATKLSQIQQGFVNGSAKKAITDAAELQKSQAASSFTALATLRGGEYYFNNKQYGEAAVQFDWLVNNASDIAMRDIARLRQARAFADGNKISKALAVLNSIESNDNISEANLLKGDILMSDKQLGKAKAVYSLLKKEKNMDEQVIEQRLNLLNIKEQLSHEKTK